jgi:hypothetical protein
MPVDSFRQEIKGVVVYYSLDLGVGLGIVDAAGSASIVVRNINNLLK